MKKQDYKIHIIGAGISGLIAATVLEKNGLSPVIIESTDRVGGRVKTDIVEGYQLDHGFQVLLTAYPAAQKYLNLEALQLQTFIPGASIFKNGKQNSIGDPLRDKSLLFSTVFARVGTLSDKFKILKLNIKLKKKSLSEIFSSKEQTTKSYLIDFGFSSKMINDFFNPFFSGIFLENKLETSSRMFEFVYKMFGQGDAALPKGGMQAIPKQLSNNLRRTTFKFNTKVATVNDSEIILEDGQKIKSDFTIIATEPSKLVNKLNKKVTEWQSCDTLYFETESKVINKPLIGLIPEKDAVINNIFYHTSLESDLKGNKELLSVTVVDNQNLSSDKLIQRVQTELKQYCGIDVIKLIKHYKIPMSLPKIQNLQYNLLPSQTRLTDTIFLAGDVQLNGSLNAAMIAGEKAAHGVLDNL
ncbi:NAD(P)/FAD-dependent oxidoreductase [Olleya sp. Hel_I_94]|uniref:NAD(P)/FAD-dependent oxidoreductase n=1 Tax=Olleya sp. Hel_I_94 TaxID=1250001 RepID=UPI00119D9516|nr:NAD(P)/FAD-dependent oxidoreductase [Olleya sp. Hel_I_94]TVZ46508.1 flavin-dependent amine oxidoreductase [Olleya sp. Hel_I_94]